MPNLLHRRTHRWDLGQKSKAILNSRRREASWASAEKEGSEKRWEKLLSTPTLVRWRGHGSTYNISHHVIHAAGDTREHASHLQLSLPPFSHSLIVLSSQFVVVFMRPYKTGKGRVKKEGTSAMVGEILRRLSQFILNFSVGRRTRAEPTELGTFNFIGEGSASLPPSSALLCPFY